MYTILVNDDNTFALGYTPYTPTEVDNKIDDLEESRSTPLCL